MKTRRPIFILCVFFLCWGFFHCSVSASSFVSSVSSDDFLVSLSDFSLGSLDVEGDFHISVLRKDGYYVYMITAQHLRLGQWDLNTVEAKVIKKGEQFNIPYVRGEGFLATGKIDPAANRFSLNVTVTTDLALEQLRGTLHGKFSAEGDIHKPWIKGEFSLRNGEYCGKMFSEAGFSCSGYLPYLRLSNSEFVLYDGSRYSMEGFINLSDLKCMLASSEMSSKEVSLGEWKVFSGVNSAGFSKDIDTHMGVAFGSVLNQTDETDQPGAEFRYQFDSDKFLKLRMEENRSIVGFEQRNEF